MYWWSQKAPSTRRCINTRTRQSSTEQPWVRKHPAPEGALRLGAQPGRTAVGRRQKAPSTRRCIKTESSCHTGAQRSVRKHPAPEGALRRKRDRTGQQPCSVRKHPAPEGALRPLPPCPQGRCTRRQKAPSTTRCIKTPVTDRRTTLFCRQKALSARRCIKTSCALPTLPLTDYHQKAPSTTRCIKTRHAADNRQPPHKSESTQHQKMH